MKDIAKNTLDRLRAAVQLEGADVAIRVQASYAPQGGPGQKVFPPTYLPASDGSRYHFEQRWGPDGEAVDVVILDSIQSQANRAERALLEEAGDLGLPQIVMRAELDDRIVTVSSLEAPHRSRDAYFLDSELDGTSFDDTAPGAALASATTQDATAFLQFAPYDLVYGVWDSHRGKRIPTKFPRAVTSEMVGWHVLRGKKGATKGDPLNLPGEDQVPMGEWRPGLSTKNRGKKSEKLSELGHGMIPVPPEDSTGGVSLRSITRTAVVSLTGLAALRFPSDGDTLDVPGRVALAALALLGDRLAFGRAGLTLRSGTEFVLEREAVEWVRVGGESEPLELDAAAARELFSGARAELEAAGLSWDPEPITLAPSPRLLGFIERTFYVPELEAVKE